MSHTRFGSSIWNWEPFTQLDCGPQVLWIALYTTEEAKRIMPGLWHGSITTMAEAARKPVDETRIYLDALLEAELVEFDIKLRVLRLTQLPDCGESPPNANVLRGWWRKFTGVPACPVRDAHVTTVRWLMDTWSREAGKPISHGHEEVWKETFGRVVVPPPRRRGVRRLAESDTSTAVQPSLFSRPETVPALPERTVYALPEGRSVDNSASDPELNKIRDSETVSKRFPNGLDRDPDQDQDLDLQRSENRAPGAVATPRVDRVLSPEPGGGGERDRRDPVDQLLALFGEVYGGGWSLAQATPERASVADQLARLGRFDYALLGRWMRSRGTSHGFARDLLSTPGRIVWAVGESKRWQLAESERKQQGQAMSAELKKSLAAVGLVG